MSDLKHRIKTLKQAIFHLVKDDEVGMSLTSGVNEIEKQIQTLTEALAAKEKELESMNMLGDIIDQREAKIRELEEALAAKEKEAGILSGKYGFCLKPFVEMMEFELHANSGKGDRDGWL